jgi:hypothetical protein
MTLRGRLAFGRNVLVALFQGHFCAPAVDDLVTMKIVTKDRNDEGTSSRFQQFLHPRPGVGLKTCEGRSVGFGHATQDRGLD